MLLDLDKSILVKENEPLSAHSSFKIGGNVNMAIFPQNKEQLISALRSVKAANIKFQVIGNGSNLLFADEGYDGAIIFTKYVNATAITIIDGDTYIKAECGKSLTELANEAGKKRSLTGLEFAYGIPATIGGAIFMNSGAYGGQMSDIVVETEYYNINSDEVVTVKAEEQKFSYRHTLFMEHPEYIILSTTLKLKAGVQNEILEIMSKNMTSRKDKQPLEYPSAGSVFKRPGEGIFAGKLIEDSKLKGFSIGGAEISEKHAGFIVNKGGATAADVLEVIKHTQKTVLANFGIQLECEIIYIPK